MARSRAAGLTPTKTEKLLYHVHAHLDLFVDGEPQEVPLGIGLKADPALKTQTVNGIEAYGFFDHLAPPTPPPGTPGEFIAEEVLPGAASGITGPIGLGFRVPTIVVSPFSRGGNVSSDVFDHTSLLRFIETRFGVEVPNLSEWRRSTVGDLTSTLDLENPRTDTPKLSYDLLDARKVAKECKDITKFASPPLKQKLPRQER